MKLDKHRKFLLPSVFLFLVFSILLNISLYLQLRKYYSLLFAAELDPLGLSYFHNNAELPKPAEGDQTVVFFGDSRNIVQHSLDLAAVVLVSTVFPPGRSR